MPQLSLRTRKLILFSLGSQPIHFGLPIESVFKILGQTTVHRSGPTLAGIAHLEDHEITILDLHQHLFGEPLPITACLLVVPTSDGELLGIPLPVSPLLIDIGPDQMRRLPERYRHLDGLGIASHVAQAETEIGSVTLFVLDIAALDRLSGSGLVKAS